MFRFVRAYVWAAGMGLLSVAMAPIETYAACSAAVASTTADKNRVKELHNRHQRFSTRGLHILTTNPTPAYPYVVYDLSD